MSKLEQIEKSVAALSKEEMKRFGVWFAEFQSEIWNGQIKPGFDAGRLDFLNASARDEIKSGRMLPL
ncbi:MAG: hypothetical protein WCC66_00990 [Rhizobiaceae bacterium]